jgi:hypothetical protein
MFIMPGVPSTSTISTAATTTPLITANTEGMSAITNKEGATGEPNTSSDHKRGMLTPAEEELFATLSAKKQRREEEEKAQALSRFDKERLDTVRSDPNNFSDLSGGMAFIGRGGFALSLATAITEFAC